MTADRKRVILVHGFNVSDSGARTIDLLIPPIEALGYEVVQYDYGYRFLLGALLMGHHDAIGLMKIFREGDIVIGHSHAGNLMAKSIDMGMPVKTAVMIHPALDRDWHPPRDHPVDKIFIYWSPRDKATWWARFSPGMWGGMGTYGPNSGDMRMVTRKEKQTHSGGFVEHPAKYVGEALGGSAYWDGKNRPEEMLKAHPPTDRPFGWEEHEHG